MNSLIIICALACPILEREQVAAFRESCPGFVIENFEIIEGNHITRLTCTGMAKAK